MSSRKPYTTSDFDYTLPPGLVAQHPARRRDESRLMVVDRATGAIRHRVFRDIVDLVPAGDALVLNETRVFPARLVGRRESGAEAEVLLLRPAGEGRTLRAPGPPPDPNSPENRGESMAGRDDPHLWSALVRPGNKLKPGRRVHVGDELEVEVLDVEPDGTRIVRLVTGLSVEDALQRYGRMPLPPYVEREAGPEDAERYQTVYARREGSVAAPTAGLHLTPEILAALEAGGVRIVRLVLHVGVGTFRPVEAEDPAEHEMHSEWYEVPPESAAALNATRAAGGSVWAVGTTVARTLETVTDERGVVAAGSGWTDIFIRPPYRFRGVDRLVTNFHLPRSTLLMLVSALAGYELTMRAYRVAVEEGYRFYSYGDAMVIL